MSVAEHMTTFAGRRVLWYHADGTLRLNAPEWVWDPQRDQLVPATPIDPPAGKIDLSTIAYAMRGADEDNGEEGPRLIEVLDRFVDDPQIGLVEALVIGLWGSIENEETVDPIVEALVAARERFSGLKALFLGDIVRRELEISWIYQGNVAPVLEAYPFLEVLGIRGGSSLSFEGAVRHGNLRELRIETGGLPEEALRSLWRTELPELEHLVLWLGESGYGGIDTTDALEELLSGRLYPKLKYLGLCDSKIADAVAGAVASAPILERIETLDLSLGTMTDVGARALIESPPVRSLKRLDLTYHFISPEILDELRQLGIEVIADDPQEPDVDVLPSGEQQIWRYVAHGE